MTDKKLEIFPGGGPAQDTRGQTEVPVAELPEGLKEFRVWRLAPLACRSCGHETQHGLWPMEEDWDGLRVLTSDMVLAVCSKCHDVRFVGPELLPEKIREDFKWFLENETHPGENLA